MEILMEISLEIMAQTMELMDQEGMAADLDHMAVLMGEIIFIFHSLFILFFTIEFYRKIKKNFISYYLNIRKRYILK